MEPTKPSLMSNIIAGVGVLFIIVILIWIFANIGSWTPKIFDSISSFFHPTGTTLTITPESGTVTSGTPTTISWTHTASSGTYAFSYECRDGLSVSVPDAAGVSTALPCATAYVVSATGPKAIRITPSASSTGSTELPFTISYRTSEDVIGASANDSITIVGSTTTAPAKPSKPATGGTSSGSSASARPDLTVRMLGLGIMQGGTYDPVTSLSMAQLQGSIVAVRFEITNDGTASTGSWRFNATLPSNPSYLYQSVAQQSLAPGDRIDYTLQFTNLSSAGGIVTIVADPDNTVHESSEANNGISYRINVSSY